MIMRISDKLGKKIHVAPTKSLPADVNPFADWSSHLFTAARAQYIMVTNTASLYSIVMHGKGITDDAELLKYFASDIRQFMKDDGLQFIYERLIAPQLSSVSFSKALNRSVTGSMNELIIEAKICLSEEEMSPFDVSLRLNQTPLSYLKYNNPRGAFLKLKPC